MDVKLFFESVVVAIEVLAVAIISLGLLWAFLHGGHGLIVGKSAERVYSGIRRNFGRILLLGLEVLIAADIVKTVTVDLTLRSVGTLGLLVLVRTFLSWAISIETDGRWPWELERGERKEQDQAREARSDEEDPEA